MNDPLNVLLVESSPRAGVTASAALEAAGHRVHRCHDEGQRGFTCRGMGDEGRCPIDDGIDVALLVRSQVNPRPTPFEDGIRCAIRAGLPVVEDGPEVLDPYARWITLRLEPGVAVAAACAEAVMISLEPLRRRIESRIDPLVTSLGIDLAGVQSRIERTGTSLAVHLDLPVAVPRRSSQALAVRVLDAVGSMGATVGNVDVYVHAPEADTTC